MHRDAIDQSPARDGLVPGRGTKGSGRSPLRGRRPRPHRDPPEPRRRTGRRALRVGRRCRRPAGRTNGLLLRGAHQRPAASRAPGAFLVPNIPPGPAARADLDHRISLATSARTGFVARGAGCLRPPHSNGAAIHSFHNVVHSRCTDSRLLSTHWSPRTAETVDNPTHSDRVDQQPREWASEFPRVANSFSARRTHRATRRYPDRSRECRRGYLP